MSGRVQVRNKKCNNKGVKKIMNLVRVIITVVIGFNYTITTRDSNSNFFLSLPKKAKERNLEQ